MPDKTEIPSYGAVVIEKTPAGFMVLVVGGYHGWSFPKGHQEANETPVETARREVLEETSIDCEPDRIVAIHENFFRDNEGIPFHEISVFYTLKPNEKLAAIENGHTTDHGPNGEYLEWVDMDSSADIAVYPAFFRTMDFENETDVRHFIDIDI